MSGTLDDTLESTLGMRARNPRPLVAGSRAAAPAREELANVLSHALGMLASLLVFQALWRAAALQGNAWDIAGSVLFGGALVLAYLASTLYHGMPRGAAKRALRLVDHCAIYLLGASTSTALTLAAVGPGDGLVPLLGTWAIAGAGIAWKLFTRCRYPGVSLATYLAGGWGLVITNLPVLRVMPERVVTLFLAGGVAYSAGVVFFRWRRLPYHHAIWHHFVLTGSALHAAALHLLLAA